MSTSLNMRVSMKKHTEWNKIVAYNTKRYQQELKKQEDLRMEKRMKQREVLDEQMQERIRKREKEREELQQYWST